MKIYIASSWKNQHAAEMLTDLLRERGHEVLSFVENNTFVFDKGIPFEEWVWGDYCRPTCCDTSAATDSDLVIYIGASGLDAWAIVSTARGAGVPVFGLWGKGEPARWMHRMVTWFTNYRELIHYIDSEPRYTIPDYSSCGQHPYEESAGEES